MGKVKLPKVTVKDKKVWEEQLYKFAVKRFGRMSNIGFYKMFLTPKDFLHDNYYGFILNDKNFNESENFEHYCHRFINRIRYYQRGSYSVKTKIGAEFLRRGDSFKFEPNWEIYETHYFCDPEVFGTKISDHIEKYDMLNLYSQGYTYIEIGQIIGKSTTYARQKSLEEIERFKKTKVLKELSDDRY